MSRKQVVFVANHASYLDAFALAAVLPFSTLRRTHWAGWAGIALANPFNTFIYRLAQAIPIEAKRSLFSSLALGAIVLKRHENLIWFPEGERTLNGKLLPFKPGIGMLLEHFSVDVEPVFIAGTREALPLGAFFPKFKKVTVRFGEPVRSDELTGEGDGAGVPEQIAKTLQDRVQKLSRSRIKKNTDSRTINRKHDKARSRKA
jgi:long-chain acyl-CoA synthetase